MDEDAAGLARVVSGEELVPCHFCGQLVPRSGLVRLAGAPDLAEPIEALHACESCRVRIEQDEVPFDEEISVGLQAADD